MKLDLKFYCLKNASIDGQQKSNSFLNWQQLLLYSNLNDIGYNFQSLELGDFAGLVQLLKKKNLFFY